MLAASDFEVPSRKTTLRGILDFRRRRFTSRRPENQYALSSPCTLSQFLTSGETAGAEAPQRAGEAKKVPDNFSASYCPGSIWASRLNPSAGKNTS
jgi:hypothetical protein